MSIWTPEFWEVSVDEGATWYDLNNYAYNLSTLSGRESIPPRRGENFTPGRRRGQIFAPKVMDARPLSLAMSVFGADVDGNPYSGGTTSRQKFRQNYETLKELFGVYDRLLWLRKRVNLTTGVLTLTGRAEVTGTIELSPNGGGTSGKIVVDMLMTDPLWYDNNAGAAVGISGTVTTTGFGSGVFGGNDTVSYGFGGTTTAATSVDPGGTAPSLPTLVIGGPCVNPRVMATYVGDRSLFGLVVTLGSGESVAIDADRRRVTDGNGVEHPEWIRPGSEWPTLYPSPLGSSNVNLIEVSQDVSGWVYSTLVWIPAYL